MRRTCAALLAAAALAAAAAATSSTNAFAAPPPPPPPPAAAFAAFAASLAGTALTAGAPAFANASREWNARFDGARPPYAVVFAVGAPDVAAALAVARTWRLPLRLRSGRHQVEGWSVCDGCLVLDVSAGWGGVAVDAAAATAVVGAGATMAALLNATVPRGLLAPTGSCSSVGVAGFVLGGGIGWTSRLQGLAADALLAATVVLANGSVVRAERGRAPHAELLWALGGGGGGNFGVLLDVTLALAPVPPALLYFSFGLPWAAAPQAVALYLGLWGEPRFDAYALFVRPSSAPQPLVLIQGIWVGDLAAGAAALAPLGALAAATNASGAATASVTVTDYLTAHALFEGPLGARTANKQKSAFVPLEWSPSVAGAGGLELIRAALAAAPADVADNSAVYLNMMGGAINAVAPGATPFPHRAAAFNFVIDTHWTSNASAAGALAWTRALHGALAAGGYLGPAGPGGALATYVNYADADLGADPAVWGPAYYGAANFARLQAAKAAYDPGGAFAAPQAVPLPAAP